MILSKLPTKSQSFGWMISRSRAGATRTFTSKDPLVGNAANAIEAALPGRISGVNKNVNMVNRRGYREIDIELDTVNIQVKGGQAKGIVGQISDSAESLGKPTIGYAPGMSNKAWAAAMREGVPIARTYDELIAMIKEIG